MRVGHLIGLMFTVSCLAGLYLAWPYVRGWIGGTWLADLRLVVFAAFVALALSGLHRLEAWVGARLASRRKETSDH